METLAQYPDGVYWADTVYDVSSEYILTPQSREFRAKQILGKPNKLPDQGSSPCAWSPSTQNNSEGEWIEVGFKNSIAEVVQIAIAESFNAGSVGKIYLIDEQGKQILVYENKNPKPYILEGRIHRVILNEPTSYQVKGLRLELITKAVDGWNHIDAIGLSTSKRFIEPQINLRNDEFEFAEVEKLPKTINSSYDETMPVISRDGETLFFTRKYHPENFGSEKKDDIWYSKKINQSWSNAIQMKAPLNDEQHNFVCSALPKGFSLLVGNIYDQGVVTEEGVSLVQNNGDSWEDPVSLEIMDYYNHSNFSEFFLADNEKTLLMAIQRDDTYGDRDLYVSFKNKDGRWSTPKNLGDVVNTASTELTPFLMPDLRTLYFSSLGFSGFGLSDMYVSYRLDDSWNKWTEPVNLGPSLNSPDWESSFMLDERGEYAYFVSYKDSYANSADIFEVKLPKQEDDLIAGLYLRGSLFSSDQRPLLGEVLIKELDKDTHWKRFEADVETGGFQIDIEVGNQYEIIYQALGYIPLKDTLDTFGLVRSIQQRIYLEEIHLGSLVALNRVYFEQSKDIILKESFHELDQLVDLMNAFEGMEIVIEGHTDLGGSAVKNMELSKQRVKSVKNYLVYKGIEEKRILTKAYGSTRPLYRSKEEAVRKKNRRVEFRVSKI